MEMAPETIVVTREELIAERTEILEDLGLDLVESLWEASDLGELDAKSWSALARIRQIEFLLGESDQRR